MIYSGPRLLVLVLINASVRSIRVAAHCVCSLTGDIKALRGRQTVGGRGDGKTVTTTHRP